MICLITSKSIEIEFPREPKKSDGENKAENSEQLYDCNKFDKIDCCNNKNSLAKSSNELSTKFPANLSNDEFIKFLDSEFKAEIKLSDEADDKLFTKEEVKEFKIEDPEVNLSYRGQKNLHQRGKHAHRIDILFKSFIRCTRRYLWEIFEKEYNISLLVAHKPSQLYKENVIQFYCKYFKQFEGTEVANNRTLQTDVISLLEVILSNKYSFPDKKDRDRLIMNLFNSVNKGFSKEKYQKLLTMRQTVELFRMMDEAGVLDRMIGAYPVLSDSKELHLKIVRYICEDKVCNILK